MPGPAGTPATGPAGPTPAGPARAGGRTGFRRLYRVSDGRVVAGVAHGLADHLGVSVLVVRLAFIVLSLTGAGVADVRRVLGLRAAAPGAGSDASARGAARTWRRLALGSLAIGGVLLGRSTRRGSRARPFVWPLVVIAVGVALLWQQADDAQRARWRAATTSEDRGVGAARRRRARPRSSSASRPFIAGPADLGASIGVLFSALVIARRARAGHGPWWMRMARDLAAERAARIREQERAEVAAHVHDSVLHTLTLIQRNVDDPREVARLARAQERELRDLALPPGRPTPRARSRPRSSGSRPTSRTPTAWRSSSWWSATAPLDDDVRPLLLATREALVNAAKYAADAPISVFAEVGADSVTVFVRDRGPGLRRRGGARGPARRAAVRHRADAAPRRQRHRAAARRGRHGGPARDAQERTMSETSDSRGGGPDDRPTVRRRAGRRPPHVPHAACAPSWATRSRSSARPRTSRAAVTRHHRDPARRRAARRPPAGRRRPGDPGAAGPAAAATCASSPCPCPTPPRTSSA